MSTNLTQTTAAVTQTVLDLRVATAWLMSRPEIDGKQLGIMGTSLGSFVAALTGEMEPRLGRVAVLLGGGGFVEGYTGHGLAAPYFRLYRRWAATSTAQEALRADRPADLRRQPKSRNLLILAASRDDIVPPAMARMLWEASGKQKIVWFDAPIYGAAVHIADAMERLAGHFLAR